MSIRARLFPQGAVKTVKLDYFYGDDPTRPSFGSLKHGPKCSVCNQHSWPVCGFLKLGVLASVNPSVVPCADIRFDFGGKVA